MIHTKIRETRMQADLDMRYCIVSPQAIVPRHYQYPLFSALSDLIPELHGSSEWGVYGLSGTNYGDSRILPQNANLRLRISRKHADLAMQLVGARLKIGNNYIRLGGVNAWPLIPASSLWSQMVYIRLRETGEDERRAVCPELFEAAARRQLDALDVKGHCEIVRRENEPIVKKLHIKNRVLIGFPMVIRDLTEEESLRVQSCGIGGKHSMGCGLFVPDRNKG